MAKQAKQEFSSTGYNVNQPREDLSMKICGTDRRCERSIFILPKYGIRGNIDLCVTEILVA